jgi:hypothetical protein
MRTSADGYRRPLGTHLGCSMPGVAVRRAIDSARCKATATDRTKSFMLSGSALVRPRTRFADWLPARWSTADWQRSSGDGRTRAVMEAV